MKINPVISLKKINAAILHVQNELYANGLWYEGSPLTEIEIYFCSIPRIFLKGFFMHETSKWDSFMGYKDGKLYIPKLSLAHLDNSKYSSIRDVVRHEYAHAFAHQYFVLIQKKAFEIAFGGDYNSAYKKEMPADAYFTKYAMEYPREDFAETFMLYLKWKGKLPKKFTNKQLISKWNYVAHIIKKASQSYF
jgi:hypothetical protein